MVVAGGTVACDTAAKRARADSLTIAAVRRESATAAKVEVRPATGLWDIDQVSERLVRAGVSPRRVEPTPKAPDFFNGTTALAAFKVGRSGDLRVFIFADSAARRRATSALDTLTVAPRGARSPWPEPRQLIVAQNLAAVLLGADETLQERVRLALEAGAPAK